MRSKTICGLVFVAVLLISTNCFAGDYATLKVIGFSKDGRYLAFEEYGVLDGSGFPYSNIYFIDTAKNAYAAPSIAVRIDNETASEARARNRAAFLAGKKLKQLGIVKGNIGKLLVSRLITDLSNEDNAVIKFAEEKGSMYHRGDYELTLKMTAVNTKECEAYTDETQMFELKLEDKENDTSKFLQKDTTLPASRNCAIDYRMQDVYFYKDFIAVFIGVFTRGFEGPDMRFMAVTGALR